MEERFGTIMFEGKMIDLDKESIENLEVLSKKAESQYSQLENKILTIFDK